MSVQPLMDIRRGLRVALHGLEQNLDSVEYAKALEELRRIILRRIAEIDAAEALERTAGKAPVANSVLPRRQIE